MALQRPIRKKKACRRPSPHYHGRNRAQNSKCTEASAPCSRRRCVAMSPTKASSSLSLLDVKLQQLQDIVGTDAGGRGMKHLLVDGDFTKAAHALGGAPPGTHVVILSGFPCIMQHDPPTETDGPPGALAIARAAVALGHQVVVCTDDCNRAVFAEAMHYMRVPESASAEPTTAGLDQTMLSLETFPAAPLDEMDQTRLQALAQQCELLIACERAGPAADGHCYTMGGKDMTKAGLIAPIHDLVDLVGRPANDAKSDKIKFLAIGDGGNELGMGKVIDKIHEHIPQGKKIGCTVAADYLIAASVSNWGGYALAAGAALVKADQLGGCGQQKLVAEWVEKCLPSSDDETEMLQHCVDVGCRDGVSGTCEMTVDGMPLERSLQCLEDLREAALGIKDQTARASS